MASEHVRIRCGSCQAIVTFPATQHGSTEECPECGAYIDVPGSSTDYYDPNRDAQKFQNQVDEVDRQHRITRRQTEQYQSQLDQWEEVLQRKKKEIDQMSSLIERWNSLAERFEKLLSRWEKE